jgi:hypothetical protein
LPLVSVIANVSIVSGVAPASPCSFEQKNQNSSCFYTAINLKTAVRAVSWHVFGAGFQLSAPMAWRISFCPIALELFNQHKKTE